MIDVNNISVKFGEEEILKNISFKISSGNTCAIIGPSGCGKTTFLYALAGIIKPNKGDILIKGEKLTGIRKESGVILQNYGLLPWKTVRNNLLLPLKVRKVSKEVIDNRVLEISRSLEIEDKLNKYPIQLSGGEKQRVAIGRTLIYNPDLLLLDEASSALDQITKESIQDLILKIYNKNKFTVVMVTHNIEEAVFLAQNIVIMGKGYISKIIENPNFGKSRTSTEFYKKCIEVREELQKVKRYEN